MRSSVSLNVYVPMIHREWKGVSSLNVLPDLFYPAVIQSRFLLNFAVTLGNLAMTMVTPKTTPGKK